MKTNLKNRSALKFSVVTVALLGLALMVEMVERSPGSSEKNSSITKVGLVESMRTNATGHVPVADISPNGSGWALTPAGLEITTNNGTSFTLIQSPISASNIGDVAVNGAHVNIAGVINSAPVIELSADSGATWKSVILPQGSKNVGGVKFVSSNGTIVGMLVTDITSSNFSAGEWYATADGGSTWTHHEIPSSGVVTAVAGDLWLVAGPQFESLYRSADLGVTWSKVTIPAAASTNKEAMSVPGQLKNGDIVLVSTRTNLGTASKFGVTVYVSSDLGGTWKALAQTSFAGQVNSGETVSAAVSKDSIWLGASADQKAVVISSNGIAVATSSMNGIYPGGSLSSISATGNSSAWITTMKDVCPSGKTSCTEVGVLIKTVDAGKTWSLVNLFPVTAL